MKLSIQRAPLVEALQKIQSVIEKRNTVPILANILLQVNARKVSISATDLEIALKINLDIESGTDGKITVSAKQFFDIVKELPEKTIHLNQKENGWAEILCEKIRYNLVTLPAEEFPSLPVFEEREFVEARTDSLSELIDRTLFAVSTDETRPHLNGVYLEAQENNLIRMIATDGHRLSYMDREVFLKMPDFRKGMIIPRKGVSELRKLLEETDANIHVSFEKGNLFARIGDTFMSIRLIEAIFPDYRQVIPQGVEKRILTDRNLLMAALRHVNPMVNEKSRGVKFHIQSNLITLMASNPEIGEAREDVDVEYQGDSSEIAFNTKYLMDCLAVMKSDQVEILFKDKFTPGMIREASQPNHTYVVSQMRI